MKDTINPPAEIRAAVDIEQEKDGLRQAYAAFKQAKQRESQALEDESQATINLENKTEDRRRAADDCRRANVELGAWLARVRKAWPRSGPNAKGWGDFLREEGIAESTAKDWMALAGHVDRSEKFSPETNSSGENSRAPTHREAGIERRPLAPPAPLEPVGKPSNVVTMASAPRVYTQEETEAIYRREVERGLPPKAQERDAKTDAFFQSISAEKDLATRRKLQDVHLRHVTGSAEEFERAKQAAIDIVNDWLVELEEAGVLDGKEKRRQLTLLDGGKKQ